MPFRNLLDVAQMCDDIAGYLTGDGDFDPQNLADALADAALFLRGRPNPCGTEFRLKFVDPSVMPSTFGGNPFWYKTYISEHGVKCAQKLWNDKVEQGVRGYRSYSKVDAVEVEIMTLRVIREVE